MAKIHGKRTRVYINGIDVSAYQSQADAAVTVDTAETSAFGTDDKTYVVGLEGATLKLTGFWDNAAAGIGSAFHDLEGSDVNAIINIVEDGSGQAMNGKLNQYQITAPIGGVVATQSDFISDTASVRALTVSARGTISASGGTVGPQNGGTATVNGAVGWLQCFGAIAGTPIFTIEGSAGGSTGWAALITFAGLTAPEAQSVSVAGTVQPYLRANVSGGTADVWIGITQNLQGV